MVDLDLLAAPPLARSAGEASALGVRRILELGADTGRLTHVERLPPRAGQRVHWPSWVAAGLETAFGGPGIEGRCAHQPRAADLAHAGRSVIMATGTASGKSVGYLTPALTAI